MLHSILIAVIPQTGIFLIDDYKGNLEFEYNIKIKGDSIFFDITF